MTRPRGHTKRLVLATFANHPDWSSHQLAAHLNMSRDFVRATVSRSGQRFVARSQYSKRTHQCIVQATGRA